MRKILHLTIIGFFVLGLFFFVFLKEIKADRVCFEENRGYSSSYCGDNGEDSGGGSTTTTTTGTITATTTTNTATSNTITAGTEDLCKSIILSDNVINPGEEFTVTATSKNEDTVSFGLGFFNLDNLDTDGKPKPIKFASTSNFNFVNDFTVTTNFITQKFSFADFDKPDLNWNFYMPRPKHIRVDAYFKKIGITTWSKEDSKCKTTFTVNSIDPTPTPNAACVCAIKTSECATTCFYDKFPAPTGFTYSNPIKCNLPAELFTTAPNAAQRTGWCRNYYKTKGDANGDGKANLLDYFYYKSVRYGAKAPPTINVDFDGDGFVTDSADKAVILRSLK